MAPVVVLAPAEPSASDPVVPAPAGDTLEDAVYRSYAILSGILPETYTLAVISIASPDAGEGRFVLERLNILLAESRRFNLVERQRMAYIRTSRRVQSSVEVDDKSALSIGHLTGAEVVITGSIGAVYEPMKQLRIKAFDVESGELLAATDEQFR
jgi:hypothetical protein